MRISLATVTSDDAKRHLPLSHKSVPMADSLRAASGEARIFQTSQSPSDSDRMVAESVQRLEAMVYQDVTVNCAVRTTDRDQIRYDNLGSPLATG
ncbi:hypothetical protein DPMN_084801 [Dreissena polymorpha]|uniref:Uncharacterized protein n=1 Tax=Dreissena polymorpha TaxID=45954 RepID=A0A9D3YEY3_DREPO|nr:hypothetical protein DPMN_084801 [Dreissena polymorpha]